MRGSERSSWYQKLRPTAASKRDGAGASSSGGGSGGSYDFTVSGSVASKKNAARALKSGAALPQRMGVSDKDKEISGSSSAAAVSLIENHLSSRKEPPWDQDFSSMSSCRSDLDGNNPGRRLSSKGGEEEDHNALPPLLRNPHIAEFDIVEACSTSSGCCSDQGEEDGEEEEGDCDLDLDHLAGSCNAHGGGWARKRRNHNDNSFSACLPSEIKGVVADSIPLVKYSHNPYQDFRDSMLEMIREKGLQKWCDLEELLFCYLSLNSPEHHEVIKQSFSDVWQDLGSSSAQLVGLGEED